MSHQGEDGSLFQGGDRCPLPSQPQQTLLPQRGGETSPIKPHPQQIAMAQNHDGPTQPGHGINSTHPQEDRSCRYTTCSRPDHHLQSDGDPPSQLGNRFTYNNFSRLKWGRLLQASNLSRSRADLNLVCDKSPAPGSNAATADAIRDTPGPMGFDASAQELAQLAEGVCDKVATRFTGYFVTIPTQHCGFVEAFEELFQYVCMDLRRHISQGTMYEPTELLDMPQSMGELNEWEYGDWVEYIGNGIAHDLWHNPIPEPWESELDVAKLLIEAHAASIGVDCRYPLKFDPSVIEAVSRLGEGSAQSCETDDTNSQASAESFVTAWSEIETDSASSQSNFNGIGTPAATSICLANSAGTCHDHSTSSRIRIDAVVNDSFTHYPTDQNAPEQVGLDLQSLLQWILSSEFNPTFACIFLSCHVRSESKEELRSHLQHDHQDILPGDACLDCTTSSTELVVFDAQNLARWIRSDGFNPTFACIFLSCHVRCGSGGTMRSHLQRDHQDILNGGDVPLHDQLDGAALEVCCGGRVPPFLQKYMHGVFRTALLSSRDPSTNSREETVRYPATIDTFGVPIRGQNLTSRW